MDRQRWSETQTKTGRDRQRDGQKLRNKETDKGKEMDRERETNRDGHRLTEKETVR